MILQDQGELWNKVKSHLQQRGVKTYCISIEPDLEPSQQNLQALFDFTDQRFQGVLDLRMAQGTESLFDLSPKGRQESLNSSLLFSFYLAQFFLNQLDSNTGSEITDPFFFSLTSRGGKFATDGCQGLDEVQGGVAGFLKCLAKEAPQLRTRVLDISPKEDPDQITSHIMNELTCRQGPVEVGYQEGYRYDLATLPVPLETEELTDSILKDEDVVLVTGGARGITAEMVRALTDSAKASFILLGRSSISIPEMQDLEKGLEDKDLKAKLFKVMQAQGKKVSPREIEPLFKKIRSAEEIQNLLDWMQSQGYRARYHSLDITQPLEVENFLQDPATNPGKVSVFIHGAGVLDDRWIKEKTGPGFHRVLDTKIKGLFSLLDALRGHPLRQITLFSSVAGKYGNPGQSDYAAANEILNHLSLNQAASPFPKARWLSINWGPFRGGMVTAQLEKKFEAEGVELIEPEIGAWHFLRELQLPSPGEPEILVGGVSSQELASVPSRDHPQEEVLSWEESISEKSHPYLLDHVIKEPVLPMAMVIELCARSALKNFPGLKFFKIRDLEVTHGLTFPGIERTLTLRCTHEITPAHGVTVKVEIFSRIGDKKSRPQLCYQALVDLVRSVPRQQTEMDHILPSVCAQSFSGDIDQAYEEFLFHGGRLRAISAILGHSPSGIEGTLNCSRPVELLDHASDSTWITDPLVLDGMAQLGLIWLGTHQGCIGIPQGIQSYTQIRPLGDSKLRCLVKVANLNPKTYKIGLDFWFLDSESRVLGFGTGWDAVFNKSFNSYTTQAKRRTA